MAVFEVQQLPDQFKSILIDFITKQPLESRSIVTLCHSSLALTHLIETDKSLQVIACAVLTP